MLLVAAEDNRRVLVEGLAEGFEVRCVDSVGEALEILAQHDYDAVLLHLDLGESGALEILGQLRRRTTGRKPAVVAIAREFDIQSVIAIVRAGAFDVLLEASIKPRELAHLLRNAAFSAQSTAQLGERRAAPAREILVIGSGDGAEAIVLLLESSGHVVRHVARMPQTAGGTPGPRAIIVDLAAIGDGEDLLKLLAPG